MPSMVGANYRVTIPDFAQRQPGTTVGTAVQPGMYLTVNAPDKNVLFQQLRCELIAVRQFPGVRYRMPVIEQDCVVCHHPISPVYIIGPLHIHFQQGTRLQSKYMTIMQEFVSEIHSVSNLDTELGPSGNYYRRGRV